MPAHDVLPGLVADRLEEVRRADDVGEHERPRDASSRLRRAGANRLEATLGLEHGAESLERREGGPQLEDRRLLVSVRPVGQREGSTRLRGLEREVGLGPVADRSSQLGDRTRGVALVQQDLSQRLMRARVPQRRLVGRRDLAQLLGGFPRLHDVVGGERDLHLGREQASPHQRRLIGERRSDRRASSDGTPSRKLQQRQPGLGIVPTLMSLGERLLGPVEVADPQADLSDFVEPHARDREVPEGDQVLHGPTRLDLRVLECSAQAHDLRPPRPAVAREPADGLAFAPAGRRLRPLARPPVVREVPAHDDRHAIHGTGRVGGELTSDRRRRGLVDHRHALVDLRLGDEPDPLQHEAVGLQVPILEAGADIQHRRPVLHHLLHAVAASRQGELEVSMLDALGLPLQQSRRALEPAG